MTLSLLLLAATAAGSSSSDIIVTAARIPVEAGAAPVSSTLFDEEVIDALSLPSGSDLLRLSPGVTVATTGPRGTQTQLRIRGAEANHTLLFVDGIRFNDPAAGNEPRFELLTTDLLARVEIVRGPQSALWGSEAIGGVIAVTGADAFARQGFAAEAEYGSLDSSRLTAHGAVRTGDVGVSGGIGWQRSGGIDSFGAGGDRDGFENVSATMKGVYRNETLELGAVGYWTLGNSDYDGLDPVTFQRADTGDTTRNRIGAGRLWASGQWGPWSARAEASWLESANRNRLAGAPVTSTFGERRSAGAQIGWRSSGHQLIAAIDHQDEDFRARDTGYGGFTNQDSSRRTTAVVAEWRAIWSEMLLTDVAIRRDAFSAFADATTIRGGLQLRPGGGWTLHAAYGEGIAQPSFYDLYGFFPGSFAGNPDLGPERSRGLEAGVRWANERVGIGITGFSARLEDEIVETFDPITFLSGAANSPGRSRRDGVEIEARYRHADWLQLEANYTWLDSKQPNNVGVQAREVRRPRNSFNLIFHGEAGRFSWGASLAYVGARLDTDFDLFPSPTVRLDEHALASLRVGWRLIDNVELYARVENGFDADYQDVVGYNTPGRTAYAGLRFLLGR